MLPRFGEGGRQPGYNGRNRTFFFFSYEGLRLRLPQTALTTVPDANARQSAVPAAQPFLNAYPQPNGPDNATTGVAQFNATYSNPAMLDDYSLRIDHRLSDRLTVFGRYNYSPSEIAQRAAAAGAALNDIQHSRITTQTATLGSTWAISPRIANELRFNYSRTNSSNQLSQDNFGGAVPLAPLPFPSPYTNQNGNLFFTILSLSNPSIQAGTLIQNLQRQVNVVDSVVLQQGSHTLKVGVDFRRLSPVFAPFVYRQTIFVLNVPSAMNGNKLFSFIQSDGGTTLLLHNLGAFAQDTWHATPRLTVTYGLRWDVDVAPSTASGPSFPAATGFSLSNLSNLALAPTGTPAFKTTYANIAPR